LLNLLKTNYEKVYKDLQEEIAKLKSEGQALDSDAQQVAEYIQKANSEEVIFM
jgi:prefoldin subunit 5